MSTVKQIYSRLRFHIQNLTFLPLPVQELLLWPWSKKIDRAFEKAGEQLSDKEKGDIRKAVEEFEARRYSNLPELDPQRTMLFYSKDIEHSCCNWITARHFRRYIFKCCHWATQHGITTFIIDYTSTFGLLAMESLISCKNQGEDFQLYSVRSDYIGRRKSYRLIPETNLEIIFLTMECDYDYLLRPQEAISAVFPNVGAVCSEKGIWMACKWISKDSIRTWSEP